jgi:hypothetical protein
MRAAVQKESSRQTFVAQMSVAEEEGVSREEREEGEEGTAAPWAFAAFAPFARTRLWLRLHLSAPLR